MHPISCVILLPFVCYTGNTLYSFYLPAFLKKIERSNCAGYILYIFYWLVFSEKKRKRHTCDNDILYSVPLLRISSLEGQPPFVKSMQKGMYIFEKHVKSLWGHQNKYTSKFTLSYKWIELTDIPNEFLWHTSYTPYRHLLWWNSEKVTKNWEFGSFLGRLYKVQLLFVVIA